MKLEELKPRAVLNLSAACLDELKRRGVTRSTNNPVADYSELLFKEALDLTLCPKSTKGYDATDALGRKYEIKGRRITSHNASTQLSSIRGLADGHFDFLAGVLFGEDFSVIRACLVPHEVVSRLAAFRQHTNSSIIHLRESIWTKPGVIDVAEELKRAQFAHDA